jgi:uncharacterized membrane protein YphA (DoxX/SURF4 family)
MAIAPVEHGGRMKALTDNRWLLLLVRIVLGGLLITSSLSKFHDQIAFREALLAYGMLPESLGSLYAAVLPWVELLIGCCLVLGVFLFFASALSLPLVLSFTIANVYAMVHPLGPAADCSCLGSLVRLSHPASLAIDLGMILAAGLLIAGRRRAGAFSLGSILDSIRFGIDSRMRVALKLSSLAILIVAILAVTPVETALTRQDVDGALKLGRPVLLLVHEGDEDLRQARVAVLNDVEVRYGEVYLVTLRYSEARSEAKQFGLKVLPTLFIITSKSKSGSYVVTATFEGSLDKPEVTQLLDDILNE